MEVVHDTDKPINLQLLDSEKIIINITYIQLKTFTR